MSEKAFCRRLLGKVLLKDFIEQYEPERLSAQCDDESDFHTDYLKDVICISCNKPALCIALKKNVFHCNSCYFGGDIFAYISKKHNCSFKDAIELMTDKYGKLAGHTIMWEVCLILNGAYDDDDDNE